MLNWTDFETVFRSKTDYSLDQKQIDTINRHRREFGGTLYFDRIWNSIGLKQPQKSWPPKSNVELRSLWQKVVKTDVADEKKQAILYYILKDCKQSAHVDTTFAHKTFLPLKYQVLVTGLWELDHGQFSKALEHLTNPSLSPEFADDILLTLLSSTKCDDSMAMAYALTVSPPLAKSETLEAYFLLLVQTNIVEAYHFTQTREEHLQKALFEKMIKIIHEEEDSTLKAETTTLLLSLPLSDEEWHWFEEYLLRGDGSRLAGAKDSVIMRRIATGYPFEGINTLDRYRGAKINGINWDDIRLMHNSVDSGMDAA